jgi:hypothetical protein
LEHELFSCGDEPEEIEKATKLEAGLQSAGIAWRTHQGGGDYEREIPDSEGGYTLEFCSYTRYTFYVAEADAARARAILAELA